MKPTRLELLLATKELQKARADGKNPSLPQLLEQIQQQNKTTPSTTEEVT